MQYVFSGFGFSLRWYGVVAVCGLCLALAVSMREVHAEPEAVDVSFVSTPAGAAVIVNGAVVCESTPCTHKLRAGRHRVWMGSSCITMGEKVISIGEDKGEKVEVSLALEALTQPINVQAYTSTNQPIQAEVWLDGKVVGKTFQAFEMSLCGGTIEVKGEHIQTCQEKLTPDAMSGAVRMVCAPAPLDPAKSNVHKPPFGFPQAKIVNVNRIYPLGKAHCLTWPDPSFMQRVHPRSWQGFRPRNEIVSTVLWSSATCDTQEAVFLVSYRGHWMAFYKDALEFQEMQPHAANLQREAQVSVAGLGYNTAQLGECLSWPSEELKKRSVETWSDVALAVGTKGTIVGASLHCDTGKPVYFLDTGERVVAMDAAAFQVSEAKEGEKEKSGKEKLKKQSPARKKAKSRAKQGR